MQLSGRLQVYLIWHSALAVVCSTSFVCVGQVRSYVMAKASVSLRAGDIVQTPCRYIVRQSRSLCRDYVSQDCAVILLWREAFLSLCLPLNHLFTLAIKLLSLTELYKLSTHNNMSTTASVEEEGVVLKHDDDDVSCRTTMISPRMHVQCTDLSNLNTFSSLGLLHYTLPHTDPLG